MSVIMVRPASCSFNNAFIIAHLCPLGPLPDNKFLDFLMHRNYFEAPQWMTHRISCLSMPMPNAIVAEGDHLYLVFQKLFQHIGPFAYIQPGMVMVINDDTKTEQKSKRELLLYLPRCPSYLNFGKCHLSKLKQTLHLKVEKQKNFQKVEKFSKS